MNKDFNLERQLGDDWIFKTGDAQDFPMPYTDSSLNYFRSMSNSFLISNI